MNCLGYLYTDMETKATKTETKVKNLVQDDGTETKALFISFASMRLYFVLKIETVEVEIYNPGTEVAGSRNEDTDLIVLFWCN